MGAAKPDDFDFQHASTKDVNTRLKTLMDPAGVPEAEHGFRIHGVRTAKVLVELEQGTDTTTLNKLLGWVPESKQWQAYGRLRQMAALLTGGAAPAATVSGSTNSTSPDSSSCSIRIGRGRGSEMRSSR